MLIKVNSIGRLGLDVVKVIVEVNISERGFPGFDIVGISGKAATESKGRIKTALINSGIKFPSSKKIVVNVAPAELPKEGASYDLPIAVGIMCLVSNLCIPVDSLFMGELSLDGGICYTHGVFLMSLFARENRFKEIFVPKENANEAFFSEDLSVDIYTPSNLKELFFHLGDSKRILKFSAKANATFLPTYDTDFSDILGQEQAKRVLEISAAGRHNVLMIGPPGVGKSMLAKAFPSILPKLSLSESIEVSKIYSASGIIPPNGSLIYKRPYRNPHHTVSFVGLLGGGAGLKPGEVSLAHRGVLFLDELSEFQRGLLEALRQPIEDGKVVISRNRGSVSFPSRFILLSATNPCPCGYLGHPEKKCICSSFQIERYRRKFSGPLLDRIDLFVNIHPVDVDNLSQKEQKFLTGIVDKSESISQRVLKAVVVQSSRFAGSDIRSNSEMDNELIKRFCVLNDESISLLSKAVLKFGLSARSYFKTIKIARTIADLGDCSDIKTEHIAEALQYKSGFNIG